MIVALRTFAMLCAGPLIILLGGLPALLRTGQVDLRAWVWPALVLIIIAAALRARRSVLHAIWAGLGSVGTVLLFAWLATGRLFDLWPLAWLGLTVLLALGSGIFIIGQRWLGLGLAGLAVLSCGLAADPSLEWARERPALAVISALPLFWREGEGGVQAREDAPIIRILRQRFDVRPVDSPLSPKMQRVDALLLAQPRAMSADELLALDGWVRGGGTMLLFADPLLRWPSSLPLGDRRRAPPVSMLAPVLGHWGVELRSPSYTGEKRQMLADGRLLTTMAASSFALRRNSNCRTEHEALVARCMIGRGQAVLVADADLIDDRLWLADEAMPLKRGAWTADTAGFVVKQLGDGSIEPRVWVTSLVGLTTALRWALMAGISWAIMGSVLLSRRKGPFLLRPLQAEAST
ncbi:hypothetical protein EP837_02170 [Sphingobium sp. EP60837]|nr:hypothetical protein EP837_02170 [Sphingobium sp. EP60837]